MKKKQRTLFLKTINIDKEIDSQLKTLEDELKISEEDDEEVIRTLKEDFKNPKMFY